MSSLRSRGDEARTTAVRGFETLEIWQLAHALALAVYRVSAGFPAEERFGITSQLRRSASSVGANIAEGYGRHSTQDVVRFYYVARGSLMETKNFLLLARDLGYASPEAVEGLLRDADRLSVKLANTVAALLRRDGIREDTSEYGAAVGLESFTTTSPRARSAVITTSPHNERRRLLNED